MLVSLVNSAELNGLDPEAWPFDACTHASVGWELAEVLEQTVSDKVAVGQLDALLPCNWKKEQEGQQAMETMAA